LDIRTKFVYLNNQTNQSYEMEAIQQLENGQNTPQIRQSVFNAVMKFCACDTGNDFETVGLKAENFGYVISFYATVQSNYEMIVEEFGCFQKNEWVECEPTEGQLSEMKRLLAKEILRVNTLIEDEALQEAFAIEEERTLAQYGHAGALYCKFY